MSKTTKIEIVQRKDRDFDYNLVGGDLLDYLAILSEAFVKICKDNHISVRNAVEANFYELKDHKDDTSGTDRLEDYLRAYSKDDINLIRDEKNN